MLFCVNAGEELATCFTSETYLWYEADMDVAEVLLLHFELKLPEGLDERHALNVPDGASQLLAHSKSLDNKKVHMHSHVIFSELYIIQTDRYYKQVSRCAQPVALSELVSTDALRKGAGWQRQ